MRISDWSQTCALPIYLLMMSEWYVTIQYMPMLETNSFCIIAARLVVRQVGERSSGVHGRLISEPRDSTCSNERVPDDEWVIIHGSSGVPHCCCSPCGQRTGSK